MSVIHTPSRAGTRDEVRSWLNELPNDLDGVSVEVDCAPLAVATPSFVDELIKIVIVDRRATRFVFVNASHRVRDLADRSKVNRNVADQVEVMLRTQVPSLLDKIRSRLSD